MRWLILLVFAFDLVAQNLAGVHAKQRIRVAMVGEGSLCEGTIESVTGVGLTMRTRSDTVECGVKGSIATIAKESIYAISTERHLTKGRLALKIVAAMGAIAALATIPLTSSDPESLLVLGNYAIPATAGFIGWSLVPSARRQVVLITCPDRFHCFPGSSTRPGSPTPPDER
jgi:hypothetical protein